MIRLEDQRTAALELLPDQAGCYAQVGSAAQPSLPALYYNPDGISRIMRDWKRIDKEIPEFEGATGFELYELRGAKMFGRLPAGRVTYENRNPVLPCQGAGPAYMVGMLMGDKDAVQIPGSNTDACQPLRQLAGRKPGIHKEPGVTGLDKDGVTLTAAGKQTDPQKIPPRHGENKKAGIRTPSGREKPRYPAAQADRNMKLNTLSKQFYTEKWCKIQAQT
jgi:hypothetical protein